MSRIIYPEGWDEQSKQDLDLMFRKAREERKWFYVKNLVGEFWFTPDELQIEQEAGRYVWGATNWALRSPHEYLSDIRGLIVRNSQERVSLQKQLFAAEERLTKERT